MTVTYHHSANAEHNPAPPSSDAIATTGRRLMEACFTDNPSEFSRADVSIMGYRLSPSPELGGEGCAVLDVDYIDGKTRTFDVDHTGDVVERFDVRAHRLQLSRDYVASELRKAGELIEELEELARRRTRGGDVVWALAAQLDAARLDGRRDGLNIARAQLDMIDKEV